MPSFLPDTSCMIASVSTWHEHHVQAAEAIEERLSAGDKMFVAAHSLVEMYSVLTRLPPGRRVSPANAHALVVGSFVDLGSVITLPAQGYLDLLDWLQERGIAGGRTYDALIVATAEHAGVEEVLALNARDFMVLTRIGIRIVII
jgi:predicted nucleic acid-binding protein